MLRVSHIKKSFGDQEILKDVSFHAKSGQLTILEGQNGAGKSSVFNILLGLLQAHHGHIYLDEKDISATSSRERSFDIAVLKQDPKASSSASLTVLENFALASLKHRTANLKNALRPCIKTLILNHLQNLGLDFSTHIDKPMSLLSGGQRQVLAFAMATMYKPKLLLLDEPTAALDDKSSHQLMQLIKRLVKDWDIPALMISHDHALNQTYGDEIFILADGICRTK